MWRLNACFLLILPEPVKLKRIFAPEFVFILGILRIFNKVKQPAKIKNPSVKNKFSTIFVREWR